MRDEMHRLLPDRPFHTYAEYLRATGGSALDRARSLGPACILAELGRSKLRGRGGAGFSVATKWATLFFHSCPTRYVVCNAAEGEPGTFKDRFLLRKNPYAVIEGLYIAGLTLHARAGFIALKSSFHPELSRVREALDEMRDVMPEMEVHVVEGPEEYLFGEEKALLNVIEGIGPLPREAHYPPYEVGLFARLGSPNPALVQNAETLAHVSTIVRSGGDSFATIGSPDTPGTIIVTLSGALERPGVYEVTSGISLERVLQECGGGMMAGHRVVGVLSGVSTGVLGADKLDTPLDFGSMQRAGSGLGSGGFVVLDDNDSMASVTREVARFLYVESCNQCSACKTGLAEASRALDDLCDPERSSADEWERALLGAQSAPQGNRCYLPVQGSVLIPSLLNRYRREVLATCGSLPRAWTLPKIVDYDESTHRFVYDRDQARKLPDWTYREPAVPAGTPPPVATTTAHANGNVDVHLPPELIEQLESVASDAGLDLDHQLEATVRDWLNHYRLS